MDIKQTRICNEWNFELLAKYFNIDREIFLDFYRELDSDSKFLNGLNEQLLLVRKKYGFKNGIFKMESIPSLDWFAFERVLLYALVRLHKPRYILETGVFYGGNTAFMLNALNKNNDGQLISIDLPDSEMADNFKAVRHPLVGDSEKYTTDLKPGFIVPSYLKEPWTFLEGDSHAVIPELPHKFEFYLHDSEHSREFVFKEMSLAKEKLTEDAIMVVDDIDWSNGFFEYCVNNKCYPLLLTDNGKDNLRVRTGVIWQKHPYCTESRVV